MRRFILGYYAYAGTRLTVGPRIQVRLNGPDHPQDGWRAGSDYFDAVGVIRQEGAPTLDPWK